MDLLQVPGWPGPAKVVVEAIPYAGELRSFGRPVADYLAEILVEWVEGDEGDLDREGEKILWDVSCVAAVANPETVRVESLAVPALDAAGAHDWRTPRRGRTVDVLTDLDPTRVLRGLGEALARLPVASSGGPA